MSVLEYLEGKRNMCTEKELDTKAFCLSILVVFIQLHSIDIHTKKHR